MRGDGFIYKRGAVFWFGYWKNGRLYRESLKTQDEGEAEKRAKRIRNGLLTGATLPAPQRRATVNDILDDLITHFRVRRPGQVPKSRSHLKSVRLAMGHLRADQLTTADVERYQAERKAADRAPATINRSCELLRQAFRLAAGRTPPKVPHVPSIPLLPVSNARQGFLSRADMEAILEKLTDVDVRDFVEWFWWTGMRPSEIRRLTWDMLNRESWTLHLDPKAAKTGKGRVLAMLTPKREPTPLSEIIERRLERRDLKCNLIFHRTSKGEAGQPVKDIRKQWAKAVADAGVASGITPYDLRRSALRNMLRSGVHERVVMSISGHRTRSTFDRYNISSEEDVAAAIEKTAAFVRSLPTERKVTKIPSRGGKEE